jgi:hypothetical protein
MLQTLKADITTDASGDATVELKPGINRNPTGLILALKYTPGTIVTGADLTITGKDSGIPILTVTNAGTSNVWYYPRALPNEVADASAGSSGTEWIPVNDEPVQVVVEQGGATKAGSIEVILLTQSPY